MKYEKYAELSQKAFKKTIAKIPDETQIERNLQLERAGILIDYKAYLAITLFSLVIGCILSLILTFFIYFILPRPEKRAPPTDKAPGQSAAAGRK